MGRVSFATKDLSKGAGFFQEGTVVVDKSVTTIYQFPPNKDNPKEQSDPFTCMKWTCRKLDSDFNVASDEDVVLHIRIGTTDIFRPGMLKEKDFDDADVFPKDLGTEVDIEGNSLHVEGDHKISDNSAWGRLVASLEKCGFKESVLQRGVASDYEGMILHLKQSEPESYVAKKGPKAGQKVSFTNTIADRVHKFPYDKSSKVKVGGGAKSESKGDGDTKANGKASDEGDSDKLVAAASKALNDASKKFKEDFFTGKPKDRKTFATAMVRELMRQDVDDKLQGEIMAFIKSDTGLKLLGKEVGFKVTEDSVTFAEE